MEPSAMRHSPVVDSQVHVWLPEGPDRPWPSWGPQWRAAAHRADMTADVLLGEMSDAGVDRAVIVPPLFEGYRNDYGLETARSHPDRFRVMARLDLDAPDLVERLDAMVAEPLVPGVRMVFVPQDSGSLADRASSALWAAAQEREVPIMLACPNQMGELAALARRYPGLRLAVDHMGLSGAHTDAEVTDEVAALVGLAELPTVSVKLSALACYSTEPYPHPALLPYARAVIEAFGAARVFWGSDLSRLPDRYVDSVNLVREHLGLDPPAADEMLGRSLLRWLPWDGQDAGRGSSTTWGGRHAGVDTPATG